MNSVASVLAEAEVLFPDPSIYQENGTYYLIGTENSPQEIRKFSKDKKMYPLMISKNGVDWQRYDEKGERLACIKMEESKGNAHFWAPQIFKHNNRYYLAYSSNLVSGKDSDLKYMRCMIASTDKIENGFKDAVVLDTDDFGVIPQFGSLGGYNVFYRPTYAIVTNPLLSSVKKTIGIDCEIIKLQPDYSSVLDIVNYYADMLALCSQSVAINLLYTHTATVYPAVNKSMAESYKKMFDKVASGEPAVIIGKELFDETGKPLWTPFERDVKNLYISDQILADMRKIEARFDTDIGIPNNDNEDKRERLIVDEVNANNAETGTRAEMWLEELKKSCDKVNNMFNITVSVDWRINPYNANKGGMENGTADSNGAV